MVETKTKVGVGLGIAAAATAAFVTLLADGNRRRLRGWMLQMKGEVLERLEDLKDFNKETYDQVVDEVTERYRRVKRVSAAELKHINGELKGAWKHIAEQVYR